MHAPTLAGPVEAKTRRSYFWRIGCVTLLFWGIAGGMMIPLAPALLDEPTPGRLGIFAFLLGNVLLPLYFPLARRRSVKRLDADGVTLRNGRCFPWSALLHVESVFKQSRVMGRMQTHYVLHFDSGKGYVYPTDLDNPGDVTIPLEELRSRAAG